MNKLIDNKSIDSVRRIINCAVIFSLFLIVLSTCPVGAATYYVKNGGNDSAAGTSSAPWATIAKVAATATSGDTVYFDNESTWSGTLPVLTARAGITYNGSSWGMGTRAKLLCTNQNNTSGIILISGSNSNVKGFEVTASNGTYATNGINICSHCGVNVSNVTIDNMLVHDIGGTQCQPVYGWGAIGRGIYVGTFMGNTISNVTITNNEVYNINYGGIVVYPTWNASQTDRVQNVTIRGNTVHDTGRAGGTGCYADDHHGDGIYIKDDADDIIIEYNHIYANPFHGINVECSNDEPAETDPQAITVRYNIIHDNLSTGIAFLNGPADTIGPINIYGNIFYNNAHTGGHGYTGDLVMTSGMDSSVVNIYNNTFYNADPDNAVHTASVHIGNIGSGATVTFKNNIVNTVADMAVYDPYNRLIHSNNLIYRSDSASNAHVNNGTNYNRAGVTTWEATAKNTAPAFISGTLPTYFTGTYGTNMVPNTTCFALGSASPAINAGTTLGSPYNGCINGAGLATPITRPQGAAYDIGAYEYAESGGVVPPPVVPPPVVTPPVVTPPAAPKNLRVVE